MCLLALYYRLLPSAPLLVAANREEFYDRPFLPPQVQGEGVRFLAGTDQRAGGTWLGVNERGLLVAVTNRPEAAIPQSPRSRGLLCRDLLSLPTLGRAIDHARRELASGHYAGANFVVCDSIEGLIFAAAKGLREVEMTPGVHLVTNGPVDDAQDPRQALAREMFSAASPTDVDAFLEVARRICRQGPDERGRSIVLRRPERGTISSTLLAVTADPRQACYEFSAGAPDVTPYDDYSQVFREMLVNRATDEI